MNKITWELPLKTVSEANSSEHWTKKRERHQQQQFFIRALFNTLERPISLPCCIKMIRVGPKHLDVEENLPMAFKWVKDEIGACLCPEKIVTYISKNGKIKQNKGHCDSDERITWHYAQEKAKTLGIRLEISFEIPDMPVDIVHV